MLFPGPPTDDIWSYSRHCAAKYNIGPAVLLRRRWLRLSRDGRTKEQRDRTLAYLARAGPQL